MKINVPLIPQSAFHPIEERQNKYALLTRRNELNAPVLTLPTEIICTIFKLLAQPPPPIRHTRGKYASRNVDPRYVRTEIIVSHVCRPWRSMALTYADLWSTFAHDDLWSSQIPVDCLSAYLARSRNSPVDLYFRLGGRKREDWVGTVDCIVANVRRLRRFSLRIERRWPAIFLFAEIEYLAAPNLEVLEISCPEFDDEMGSPPKLPRPFFKRGTPELLSLRLDAASFEKSAPMVWDNMTTVTVQVERDSNVHMFDRCPWTAFVALIQCRNLKHLTLAGSIFSFPLTSDLGRPTVSRNLVHFRCSDQCVNSYMWLLFRAPKLELLIIRRFAVSAAKFVNAADGVRDCADADLFPSLHTLILMDCCPGHGPETAQTALQLSKATASAMRLVLVQWDDLGVMNNLLAADSSTQGPLLWPRLETITFLYQGRATRPRVPWSKCMSMLERRSSLLKKPCKLGLKKHHATQWKTSTPMLWAQFVKAGFFLGEFTDQDHHEAVPWPISGDNPFDKTSELHFLI